MATYTATVAWRRGAARFRNDCYSRAHEWRFDGGLTVPASASPHNVPVPLSEAANVDPEEAFVAALSSCHMLFFLSLAARRGIVVDSYVDAATGHMERNAEGRWAMTRVVLRPQVIYGGDAPPSPARIAELHQEAHELCFIANSVTSKIETDVVS